MRPVFHSSVLAMLLLAVIAPVRAEDAPKAEKKKKKDPLAQQVERSFQLPDTISLTDEQKTKLADLKKEYSPKVREVLGKKSEILTAEQKAARMAAAKAAKEAGKKGKEAQAEVAAAVKMTEEQQKKMDEVDGELKTLNAEIRKKTVEFLTPEQKTKLTKKKKAATA